MESTHAQSNKVQVGFFSFTEITDPGEHRAYNEWHMFDHMPEQFPLRGVAGGQRWVHTPACRSMRSVALEPLDRIHYMTLYLMTEPIDETLAEFMALGRRLHELGRFHAARVAHLSGPFAVTDARAADRVLISAAALPWRPGTGIWVTIDDHNVPIDFDAALDLPGVAGMWSFTGNDARFDGHRWRTGNRQIRVWFLDNDLVAVGEPLAQIVGRPTEGRIFSGPFATITPGNWDWFDQ